MKKISTAFFLLLLPIGMATAAPPDEVSPVLNGTNADDNTELTQKRPSNPAEWRAQQRAAFAKSEKVYVQALKQKGLLAQYRMLFAAATDDRTPAFRAIISQYVSWYQTYVGDYIKAGKSHSLQQFSQADDNASPLNAGYKSKPALEGLLELTKDRQAVFFNEAHTYPQTRILTIEMLPLLRAQGFDTFAAETLYESDKDLQTRGYPIATSGFYTQEPLYAEMVRSAIKLGFTIVPYEADKAEGDAREREQATKLYERVFKKNPKARLVVNAGFAHIQKAGKYLDGESMAVHFKKLSGIDPLCIEQTMMIDYDASAHDHPIYRAVIESLHPAKPIIFVDNGGRPWSLKANAYDVSVIFPPQEVRRERPTWLDLDGARKLLSIRQDELCLNRSPCMIEARYAGEGDDAIPADRWMFEGYAILGPGSIRDLYLRPGNYRVSAVSLENRVLTQQNVNVGADSVIKKSTE